MGTPNREPQEYSRNIREYKNPGRYIPIVFLRYSWGSPPGPGGAFWGVLGGVLVGAPGGVVRVWGGVGALVGIFLLYSCDILGVPCLGFPVKSLQYCGVSMPDSYDACTASVCGCRLGFARSHTSVIRPFSHSGISEIRAPIYHTPML